MANVQPVIKPLNTALKANETMLTTNANIKAGNAVGTNTTRNLTAANTAAKNYAAAANQVATMNLIAPNANRKTQLNSAQKHFTSAAINAASNQPTKAASHARMGINHLKNYIGANTGH